MAAHKSQWRWNDGNDILKLIVIGLVFLSYGTLGFYWIGYGVAYALGTISAHFILYWLIGMGVNFFPALILTICFFMMSDEIFKGMDIYG